MADFKHRDALLCDLAEGLEPIAGTSMHHIRVEFLVDGEAVIECDVVTAIDYLANHITWSEYADWSEASKIRVSTY